MTVFRTRHGLNEHSVDLSFQEPLCASLLLVHNNHMVQGEPYMESRRVLSYALFVIAVVLLLAVGLVANQWITGILLGLVFAIAGIIFYRRGK
ncbi:hypothetical protein ACFLT5_03020 [Chloroflexota bacterium]